MIGKPESVSVDLRAGPYEILVGAGLIDEAGKYLAPLLRRPHVFVVGDETVAGLYGDGIRAALDASGISVTSHTVAPGESSKNFATLEDLVRHLLAQGIERGDMILALGGGVVGDLAGFAASILLRGIDFVQVPTTLLAQVDSSVGGKTGINVPEGKNLIGAFHQPRLVLADTDTLDTLPRRETLAGYAETAKYGLIADRAFFEWLEEHGASLIDGEPEARRHAIVRSVQRKAAIVAADEKEAGERALLNLGHTFGHALEAEAGFGAALLHGEAVAIGAIMAFDLSVELGLCPPEDAARLRRHFTNVGLPVAPPAALRIKGGTERLLAHMNKDKKVADGKLTLILANGIGAAFVARDVDLQAIRRFLDTALAA